MRGFEISDAHAAKSAGKINAANGVLRMTGDGSGLVENRSLLS